MTGTVAIEPPQLLTVGRIAELLGEPVHRIEYLLRTRNHIRPVGFAGRARLFNRKSLAHIRHELAAIAARRGAKESAA